MDVENRDTNTNLASDKGGGAIKLTVDEIRNNLRKKTVSSAAAAVAESESAPVKSSKSSRRVATSQNADLSTNIGTPGRGSLAPPPESKKKDEEGITSTKKNRQGKHHHSPQIATNEYSLLKEKYMDLACLAEEILTYCHLLDNSRSHTVHESLSLRETVRELEKLLDSARQREMSHLGYVDQHREAISMFEKRYFHLKSRAKTHIKECQDDREKLKNELDATQTRLKNVESELYAAQSLVHSQMTEVERLKEQTKSMPSEKELTNMSLKLRRLEDENGRLATERAKLMAQLDEFGGGKREDGTGPKWSRKEHELESSIDRLSNEVSRYQQENERLKQDVREYKEYCEVLLLEVEKHRP